MGFTYSELELIHEWACTEKFRLENDENGCKIYQKMSNIEEKAEIMLEEMEEADEAYD